MDISFFIYAHFFQEYDYGLEHSPGVYGENHM
jgi:hypothetical protein